MKKIGELLVEQGKTSERDVERALLGQAEMGGKFGEVLVKLVLVSDVDVAAVLSRQLNIALQSSSGYPESPPYIEGNGDAMDTLFGKFKAAE
jgi:general secretion pathway protein E